MTRNVRIVVVSGLSGAGKNSILHALEDLGFEAVDNPPLHLVETLAATEHRLAIGLDARTRDFVATSVLATLDRLRNSAANSATSRQVNSKVNLIFATAESDVLRRRYSETRRRHPLAQDGTVLDGIEAERALTRDLLQAADWVIDTSDLPVPRLREMIAQRYGTAEARLILTLVSFAYSTGVPRDADLVFDARFLRNPHYMADLRPLTGLDPAIRTYIEKDPDYWVYLQHLTDFVSFVLPRFTREGKAYVTIAIGCTGGRHRSVTLIEALARFLQDAHWHVRIEHRALSETNKATPPRRTGAPNHSRAIGEIQ